ncbi:hypothetical protein HQN64_23310 [Enterobacteriaceae bacterium BIT-l23]|jgi:hypothetical protein|uniref:hypothetical protein n=1 Tax=Jejubacter sp. L23 TaxID=3092086 RepID=UPI0015857337|nr:hypothetical protein [Enterobacteriaceae bacterium BIT-l23]
MRLIIVDDRHYFRFVALSEILFDFFEDDEEVEVLDIPEARRRIRFGSQCYDEILIIGTLTFCRLQYLLKFLVRNGYRVPIKILLFSDIFGLKILNGPLLLSKNCALLSASITQDELLSIIKGDTPVFHNRSKGTVAFTRNDRHILERWSHMINGEPDSAAMTKNDYQISRRLKLRTRINNELSLYLLWRFSRNLSELEGV